MTATEHIEAPAVEEVEAAHTAFPVDSFRDAARLLRRPFTAPAVKFKVQAVWPKENPHSGLIVAYIDARLVTERLNLIVPHLWHDEYEPLGKDHLICRLTVDGITRQDIGEGRGKGLYSDALKRAAVKFGIGVSLYATPSIVLAVKDGHLKQRKVRDGLTLELTPAGNTHLRTVYSMWLDAHGSRAFGEPLDHGDVLDAQGDVEAGEAAVTPEAPDPDRITPAQYEAVQKAFTRAKKGGLTLDAFLERLVELGAREDGDPAEQLQSLSGVAAGGLVSWLEAFQAREGMTTENQKEKP